MKNTVAYVLATCAIVLALLFILKIATSNPIQNVALLLRGRDNAATPEMVTIKLFPGRDRKENINALRIIAPKGFSYAWTINRKSAHGIIA
ncbi:hypothetical protein N431DRAFT_490135 [Stipitochalara longipes BDJ]|nr:hypothetical protein N431DRAFT_490135 [Stipitochalara longipes BDJ]